MTLKILHMLVKFGCANCYATFKDDIIDIVRRVQGGQFEQCGKTPHSSHKKDSFKTKIEEKNEYLKKPSWNPRFWGEAAIVRDEIKSTKKLRVSFATWHAQYSW